MTDDRIRVLASASPTPNLTRQLGEELDTAKALLSQLVASFTRLDGLRDKLTEHGIIGLDVDLGEVGKSALNTHRLVVNARGKTTFTLDRKDAA